MPDHNTLRRLVGCRSWRWMGGMLTHTTHAGGYPTRKPGPLRITGPDCISDALVEGEFGPLTRLPYYAHPDYAALEAQHGLDYEAAKARALPDPTDPATVGCLLALAREATGCPDLVARRTGRGSFAAWLVDCVGCPSWLDEIQEPTEAGALIAAILAADAVLAKNTPTQDKP